MKTVDFDYQLPQALIAQTPAEPRDASRLMVIHRGSGSIEHRVFREIQSYFQAGDLLVLNQTRVIPARLFGRKTKTGGKVELLLLARRDERTWEALVRGKKLRPGTGIHLESISDREGSPPAGVGDHSGVSAQIVAETAAGGRLVRFERPIESLLDGLGVLPLPPYIHEPLANQERYQTVYGHVEGSVAASTAGLHFTPELLVGLRSTGVELAYVTLHIGLDTFRPVKEETVENHQIHTEWYEMAAQVAEQINRARLEGRRVIAVGTTVVRALESSAGGCLPEDEQGKVCSWRSVSANAGPTDLFIYPGYRFKVVSKMLTNFHTPRSSLLVLVSAFAGRERIIRAYETAVREGYRFFSYGDAMLIV